MDMHERESLIFDGTVEHGTITLLKGFAWFDLIAGVIGAVIVWAKFSSQRVVMGLYSQTSETVVNPVAIGIGIAVLLQGIFTWALLRVVASIASNLIAIRKNTEPETQSN